MGTSEILTWIGGILVSLITAGLGLYYFLRDKKDGKKEKKTNEDLGSLSYIAEQIKLSQELNKSNEMKFKETILELKNDLKNLEKSYNEYVSSTDEFIENLIKLLTDNNIPIPKR